ncbi:hypothetical protein K0B04_00845 [Patescibacteria group bacterium]|nr:hypothetical protein [Patescibacteria group bacterium]
MKKICLAFLFLLLVSCSSADYFPSLSNSQTSTKEEKSTTPENELQNFRALEYIYPSITVTVRPTSTKTPKPSQTPEKYDFAIDRISDFMSEYNYYEVYYISDYYWKELSRRIESYGNAERITVLKFDGRNLDYNFFEEIEYLMDNDFHFVTIHELRGFVTGMVELPLRSIVLVADGGVYSRKTINDVTSRFTELENTYDYRPHLQLYIWTNSLNPEENSACLENMCWEAFREAKISGFYSFGTNSESRSNFSDYNTSYIKTDIEISKNEIFDELELNVYSILWPYGICVNDQDLMKDLSILIGFGAPIENIDDIYVNKGDEEKICLPLLLVPYEDVLSTKPEGNALQEILEQMGQ